MPGCGPACTKVLRWETFGCLRVEAPWALGLLVGSGGPSQEHHLLLPQSGNRRDSTEFTKAVKEVPFPPSTCSLPSGGRAQNSAWPSKAQELPPPLMVRGGKGETARPAGCGVEGLWAGLLAGHEKGQPGVG